jgi:hypothetical protein
LDQASIVARSLLAMGHSVEHLVQQPQVGLAAQDGLEAGDVPLPGSRRKWGKTLNNCPVPLDRANEIRPSLGLTARLESYRYCGRAFCLRVTVAKTR